MGVVIRIPDSRTAGMGNGPDVRMSQARERMRRTEVEASLGRLLTAASGDRLRLGISRDMEGRLVVLATIDGRSTQHLTQGYPEDRIDDFAGIVRTALSEWRATMSRRMAFAVV